MRKTLSNLTTEELENWEAARDEVNRRLAAARSQGVLPMLGGIKMGRWSLTDKSIRTPKNLFVEAVCDCGKTGKPCINLLIKGHTLSCGCFRIHALTTHGHSTALIPGKITRTLRAYRHMIARCSNPNYKNFHRWGGRGIKVCDRWLESFQNFLDDMGECPPKLTIERINNDGNYEPGNCKWVTQAQQMRNTSRTHFVIYKGQKICLQDLSILCGVNRYTIYIRLKRGWTVDEAVQPANKKFSTKSKRNLLSPDLANQPKVSGSLPLVFY